MKFVYFKPGSAHGVYINPYNVSAVSEEHRMGNSKSTIFTTDGRAFEVPNCAQDVAAMLADYVDHSGEPLKE